jgi:hypothetical protein
MMRIVEFVFYGGGRERSSDCRRPCNSASVPLREPFFYSSQFAFPGGVRILVRDEPGALAHEHQQQCRGENLRLAESLR